MPTGRQGWTLDLPGHLGPGKWGFTTAIEGPSAKGRHASGGQGRPTHWWRNLIDRARRRGWAFQNEAGASVIL